MCLLGSNVSQVFHDVKCETMGGFMYIDRIYSIWHNMKTRCYNTNAPNFKYYGGRGITMCYEWHYDFREFYKWALMNGYSENLTIDRIDNEKGYYPENCRWATVIEQNNNTRANNYITHNGETKTASEWARQYGIHRSVFNSRIRRGWTFEEAVDIKPRKYKGRG